jgi:myxalamid-type polyketide synthase MxaE and MxaD
MSLEDGLRLTIARGRLMQSLPPGGAMAAVMAAEADVRDALHPYADSVSVAAINGPQNIVISGPEPLVQTLCERFAARDIQTQRLVVSHAFHSTLMDPILDAFESAAAAVAVARPRMAVVSNVTGRIMAADERLDAAYWRAHARQPVRFADGIRALAADGCTVFVEIGPSATLCALGAAAIRDGAAHWVPSLRRGREGWEQVAEAVARLYEAGTAIDWKGFDKPYERCTVTLPTYAFQRERYWLDDDAGIAGSQRDLSLALAGDTARVADLRRRCSTPIPAEAIQKALATTPEPAHSPVRLNGAWRGDGEALGRIDIEPGFPAFRLQACLFELCTAIARAGLGSEVAAGEYEGPSHVVFDGSPQSHVWCRVRYVPGESESITRADVTLLDDQDRPVGALDGLLFKTTTTKGWTDGRVYQVAWRQVPDPPDGRVGASRNPLDASGRWIVLAEKAGSLGADIARRLTSLGGECAIAYAGDTTRREDDGRWTLDPSAPDGFDALIADGTALLRGVVHCLSLDAPPLEDATAAALTQAGVLTCGSLLHVAQALARSASGARIWVVTKDAVAAVPEDTLRGVTQTPAWGFGRVLSVEHPELWGGLIDISAGGPDAAPLIVHRVLGRDDDDQSALRPAGRFVPRLVAAAPPVESVPLRRDASYLVTGGTGGLGLLVARDMARQGAGHLLLVSRTGVPPRERWTELPADSEASRQAAAITEIEALGTTVTVVAADIGDPDAQPVLSAALAAAPPVRGVVHAAAVISPRRTRELALEDVQRMLHPKLAGTLLLERAVSGRELDFFVLFSSTAAVLGAAELAHYAAANAFLDGFARVRRLDGAPVTSIGWGAWERIRGSAEQHRAIDRGGMKIMPAARTLEALTRLRGTDTSHVVFAEVDWPTLTQVYETRRRRPFFDEVRPAAPAPTGDEAAGELLARIERARPAERRALLLAHVRDLSGAVLGVRPGQVDPRRGLFDMGMDSLMSVDLKTKLENTLGLKMPSTLTFNYPSVDAITDFVAGFIPGMDAAPAVLQTDAASAPSSTASPDDDLTEDELAAMLADRLNRMPS